MTNSLAAKGLLAIAMLALLLLIVVTAQDVFNSFYVVTGETGTVRVHLTPELTRQLRAEQGPCSLLEYSGTMAAQS